MHGRSPMVANLLVFRRMPVILIFTLSIAAGVNAPAAAQSATTCGSAAIESAPAGRGDADWIVWVAAQRGS